MSSAGKALARTPHHASPRAAAAVQTAPPRPFVQHRDQQQQQQQGRLVQPEGSQQSGLSIR